MHYVVRKGLQWAGASAEPSHAKTDLVDELNRTLEDFHTCGWQSEPECVLKVPRKMFEVDKDLRGFFAGRFLTLFMFLRCIIAGKLRS